MPGLVLGAESDVPITVLLRLTLPLTDARGGQQPRAQAQGRPSAAGTSDGSSATRAAQQASGRALPGNGRAPREV